METKIAIAAAITLIAIGSLFGAYRYGRVVERAAMAKAHEIALSKAYKENDELKTQLEVQHVQAENALNTLLSVKSPRVSIPKCGSSSPISTTVGILPTPTAKSTSDLIQEALDRFTARVESDQVEWSKVIENCRETTNWAVKQSSFPPE